MGVNGVSAANKLLTFRNLKFGMCLYYVWQAYKAVGASTGLSAANALEAWNKSNGKHPGDRNPPAGVTVFWGSKPGNDKGDVTISLGGGRVAATDYPVYGQVGICTIDQREKQIGRQYLGWTESIFDQKIDFTPISGAPAPSNPTSAAGSTSGSDASEDDELMASKTYPYLFRASTNDKITCAESATVGFDISQADHDDADGSWTGLTNLYGAPENIGNDAAASIRANFTRYHKL